jgi:uncharacterized protein (DUF4415 family)
MANRKSETTKPRRKAAAPLIGPDGEVRELTKADLKKFRPAAEVLPPEMHAMLGIRHRGPQAAPVKEPVSIRLDADVLAYFRASGTGWQGRINAALRKVAKLPAKAE